MTLRRPISGFQADERGAAAVEMALVGMILTTSLMNVAEVSRYAYLASQVASASQAGAQAAIVTCDPGQTPVTTNCPAVAAAIQLALTGTSLGAGIQLANPISEGWYCLKADAALKYMSDAANKPADCAAAGVPAGKPALYLKLKATYTYQPMFPGLTLAQSFPQTITRSAMMRML